MLSSNDARQAASTLSLAAKTVILALCAGFGIVYMASHPETSSFSPTNLFDLSKFMLGSMSTA